MAGTHPLRLDDRQRLAWLRLIRSDNVGPVTFRELLNHFGSAEGALAALPELANRGGGRRRLRIPKPEEVEEEIARTAAFGARLVALGEADYPPALRHVDAPPPIVTVIGANDAMPRPAVAIVGSRNASVAGSKLAARLARDLSRMGFLIVSGLARGIDTAAHEAAVENGTVAVMAGGIDYLYPPQNGPLLQRMIAAGGGAMTEMPFGWEPRARDFPRRNRLISGMALGVVVVEAANRSGSLHTARFALEQGREIFAVPGSPLDPRSEGTNGLIRQGATLARHAEDVIEVLRPLVEGALSDKPDGIAEDRSERHTEASADERERIAAALGPTPTAVDDVIRHTGLPAAVIQLVLLELDIAGRLERHGGQLVSLVEA